MSCPRCGNKMELFQLTYPDGYRGYKTGEGYEAGVMGFGLYEGLDYTIKKGKKGKS